MTVVNDRACLFCSGRRDVSFIFIDSWHILTHPLFLQDLPWWECLKHVSPCPPSLFIKYRWDTSLQDNFGLWNPGLCVSLKQERWKDKPLLLVFKTEVLDGPCFRNLGWPGSCWDGIYYWSLGWGSILCAVECRQACFVFFFFNWLRPIRLEWKQGKIQNHYYRICLKVLW